jgi:hypothetical protein
MRQLINSTYITLDSEFADAGGTATGHDHHLGTSACRSSSSRSNYGPRCTRRMKSSTHGGGSLGLPVGDEHFVVLFLVFEARFLGVA